MIGGSLLMQRMYGDRNDTLIKTLAVPTGYNGYDFYSGELSPSITGSLVLNGGIWPRLCNIIGASSTGKTALAIQLLTKAVDRISSKYGNGYSELYFFDVEQHTSENRFMELSGWSSVEFITKSRMIQQDLTIVKLAEFIMDIYDKKTRYKSDFLINTGLLNIDGSELITMSPTFILLDSVSQVNVDEVDTLIEHDKSGEMKKIDQLSNNMESAQNAKAWTVFVRKIKPMLDKANIGLYCINHTQNDIQTNMYQAPKRYLPFLAPGEKIRGGDQFIMQSYNIIKIVPGKKINEKDPIYGPDIDGFSAAASFVKNKRNAEGVTFPMVFDKSKGYIPALCDMEYLWDSKFGIKGTSKLCFDVLPEITFTRKTLLEQIEAQPALGRALSFTTRYRMMNAFMCNRACSLEGIENIPLNRRLAMLYQTTEKYNIHDYSDAESEFNKIAINNRKYIMVESNKIDSTNMVGSVTVSSQQVDSFKNNKYLYCTKQRTPDDMKKSSNRIYVMPDKNE